jgi:uncharacterized protein (DUF58 family)
LSNHDPSTDTTPSPHRYLRVQELNHLRDTLFAPRRPVRGAYAGRHTSRQRGHCVEFNDYREYTPGDEVADIDWKAYGRSDRLFIKIFEHQADMTVSLLVDASASMGYAGLNPTADVNSAASWMNRVKTVSRKRRSAGDGPGIVNPSKYDQACLMAAAVAFLTVRQQDRVGFATAQQGLHDYQTPRGGFAHLNHVLRSMERARPAGRANLPEALHALVRRARRRGLLVVFSDLMEDRDPIMRGLSAFTSRGGEVIVFHVLHADELELPDLDEAIFVDSETGRRVRMNVRDVRPAYQARIRRSVEAWRTALTARGIDYQLASTATHYHEAIRDYLFTRAARA